MAVELVIFDCDGVLFRSEAANIAFYNEVRRQVGEPPLDDDGEAACHALASAQLFEKHFGDRPRLLARVREVAKDVDYGPFFPLMEPMPDLYEVLGQLRRRYRTALATNRGRTVHGVLDYFGLTEHFDLAVGVFDVDRPKPHPDMIVRCLETFEVEPGNAVYVGDQEIDAASAAASGVHFVAMGPAIADADRRIEQLAELHGLLSKL